LKQIHYIEQRDELNTYACVVLNTISYTIFSITKYDKAKRKACAASQSYNIVSFCPKNRYLFSVFLIPILALLECVGPTKMGRFQNEDGEVICRNKSDVIVILVESDGLLVRRGQSFLILGL
jgi:hypothetical protein